MSDFEKESLFNCYAGPDDTMDYRKFVHDVLEHPLNRSGAQFYTGDSLLRSDYNRFDKKEKELQEKELVRAGSALKADRSLVKKLYQAMYLPSREALGTLRLVAYFQKCQNGTGSDRYLKKKVFLRIHACVLCLRACGNVLPLWHDSEMLSKCILNALHIFFSEMQMPCRTYL